MDTVIVFSHLRWNFVFQRPQQLLSRMAQRQNIIFFEEPVFNEGEAFIDITEPLPHLQVWRPHTSCNAMGFHDEQLPYLKPLLAQGIKDAQLSDYVVWFYTPMALPLAQSLTPKAVIYDCMDELSAFLNAPRQLLQRETALLKVADLVFTGGPSLYEAKKDRSEHVYCFPSSVDAAHFSRGQAGQPEATEQAELLHPRLEFFGEIDERVDLALIDALALQKPAWQIMLVGPVVKIDPAQLPQRPNIHYFGQQDYARLPELLAGWDVCLLPFARNAATRFISPTKTLEYMAAERPIVSTPITDVAQPYGDIVYLGDNHADFIAACESALSASDQDRETRTAKMRTVLTRTSWDATVEAMQELIAQAIEVIPGPAANDHQGTQSNSMAPVTPLRPPLTKKTGDRDNAQDVIIGAGPTGLSVAYHLGQNSLLLEQNDTVGGWCRSVQDQGFTFDHAGHIMFSNDDYVHQMYTMLLATMSTGRSAKPGFTASRFIPVIRSRGVCILNREEIP